VATEGTVAVREIFKLVGILGYGVVLSGCVLSVDGIIPESDATFDPRLLGTWEEVSGSDRAIVSRATENTYAIEYTSDGTVGRFEARLGRLGERMVLDAWPAPRDHDLPAPHTGLLIAAHVLLPIDVGSNEVRLTYLEPEALDAALRAGQVRLAYQRAEDQLILCGTTEELRSALGPHVARAAVLAEPDVWRRARDAGPAGMIGPVTVPCLEASTWREADHLFHRDPHWVGGDGASSVDLGSGRILWLFGDSWIDPSGQGTRRDARMVSNSIAIQIGTDPVGASIRFYWGHATDGSPAAFVPDDGDERHWFGNGVRVEDRLLLFLNRVRNSPIGLGFESVGWTAWMVENPDAEPSAWRMRQVATQTNPLGVVVGFAAVLRLGEHVYAFGSQDPVKSHPIYAARWPTEQVRQGNLLHPEWWAGERLGWLPDSSSTSRWPLFENGQSELSIHVDEVTGRFLVVQTEGFGPADVMMRAAPTLTGPWPGARLVYRPPEFYRPNVMIYSAKAHPELTGADLVLTYDTNTFQFAEQLTDSLIYYPRFLRLTRCR
jgi:hypothetical protein